MSKEHGTPVDRVSLVEVGPRDGLQNEPRLLSLAQRLLLINRLAESGLQRIEVAEMPGERERRRLRRQRAQATRNIVSA